MWFKNLRLYRLVDWPKIDSATIGSRLAEHAVRPCGRLEPATAGWSSPYGGDDERLVHSVGDCHLMRYAIRERVLPTAVVKEKLGERIEAFRQKTGSRPTRKQQVALRDEVMMELLPQAFVKPAHTDCYVDTRAGWLVVDAGSAKRAEDVATLLRHSFDGARLQAIDASNKLKTVMTHWLAEADAGGDFELGEECDLRDDRDAGSTVKCRKQDLEAPEIRQHLKAGKMAMKLGLIWAERLRFTLGEDLSLARLKPEDVLVEQMEDLPEGDEIGAMDAEFALMTLEVRALLEALVETFDLKA